MSPTKLTRECIEKLSGITSLKSLELDQLCILECGRETARDFALALARHSSIEHITASQAIEDFDSDYRPIEHTLLRYSRKLRSFIASV